MLGLLLFLVCMIVFWNFALIIEPLRRSNGKMRRVPIWLSFAITLSIIAATLSILRGRFFDAVIGALFPPVLLLELANLYRFQSFLLEPLVWSFCASLFFFIPLFLTRNILRHLSLFLSFCVFMVVFLAMAERNSRSAMIAGAKEIGASTFERHSFLWSLRNAPREFQFEVHALARVKGQSFIWSYREQKFVFINPTIWAETSPRAEIIRAQE